MSSLISLMILSMKGKREKNPTKIRRDNKFTINGKTMQDNHYKKSVNN